MPLPPRALVALTLAGALLAGACTASADDTSGDDGPQLASRTVEPTTDSGPAADASTATGPDDDLVAVDIAAEFVDGPCEFDVPTGTDPRCGTVTVPMDWETGDGEMALAVAVFPATTDRPAPDPVIYLEGGPGAHALDTVQFAVDDLLTPLQARGELIMFDQRGAGRSRPSLDCPETDEVARAAEDDPAGDRLDEQRRFEAALGRCHERLTAQGIDPADINSVNNAHDVEAIRVALGYDTWNLFGVSYGTKLALEVLRRHPGPVRAVVLDSVFPPQVDSVVENPATFIASYDRVVAACAAEPACAAGGDLGERLAALVARYEADPVRIEVRDWIADERDEVYVSGETIVGIVTGALYTPNQFTDLPELVAELERGELAAVETFLSQDRTTERFFTNGMFYAVACQDEISFADQAEVVAAVPADPFGLIESFDYASNNGPSAFGTCAAFDGGTAPASSNRAVSSDVPTLLLAGVYDPITPVAWAEQASATLTNGRLVIAPHESHGVSSSVCGRTIVAAFFDDPSGPLDERCLQEDSFRFVGPSATPVDLEDAAFTMDGYGLTIDTVRPVGWSVGSLGGDQYRRDSFLDPTQLFQLAGDTALGAGLAEFVEDGNRVELSDPVALAPGDGVGPIGADDLPDGWRHRSARSERVVVEWFESGSGAEVAYVILVSTPAERDRHLETVVAPALAALRVTPG